MPLPRVKKIFAIALLWSALVLLWALQSRLGGPLPPPQQVITAWFDLASSGELAKAIVASLQRVAVGFGIAVLIGCTIGALVSVVPNIRDATMPLVELLRPISPLAWTPIAIAWFGLGDPPAYFIVFIAAVYPILLNTILGAKNVTGTPLDAARSLGADYQLCLTDVCWPLAKPAILTGLRLGLGMSWISLIAAELIGVQSGLGYLIEINRRLLRLDNVLAVMGTIGVLGLFFNVAMEWYGRKSMPWLPKQGQHDGD